MGSLVLGDERKAFVMKLQAKTTETVWSKLTDAAEEPQLGFESAIILRSREDIESALCPTFSVVAYCEGKKKNYYLCIMPRTSSIYLCEVASFEDFIAQHTQQTSPDVDDKLFTFQDKHGMKKFDVSLVYPQPFSTLSHGELCWNMSISHEDRYRNEAFCEETSGTEAGNVDGTKDIFESEKQEFIVKSEMEARKDSSKSIARSSPAKEPGTLKRRESGPREISGFGPAKKPRAKEGGDSLLGRVMNAEDPDAAAKDVYDEFVVCGETGDFDSLPQLKQKRTSSEEVQKAHSVVGNDVFAGAKVRIKTEPSVIVLMDDDSDSPPSRRHSAVSMAPKYVPPYALANATPSRLASASGATIRASTPTSGKTSTPASGAGIKSTPVSGAAIRASTTASGAGIRASTPVSGAGIKASTPVSGVGIKESTPVSGAAVRASTPASGAKIKTSTPVSRAAVRASTPVSGAKIKASTPVSGAAIRASTPASGAKIRPSTPVSGAAIRASTPTSGSGIKTSTPASASSTNASSSFTGERRQPLATMARRSSPPLPGGALPASASDANASSSFAAERRQPLATMASRSTVYP